MNTARPPTDSVPLSAVMISHFLHGQVACWNGGDREAFFAHYRAVAPKGLSIEYVGKPPCDGWVALEAMWLQQNARIRIDVRACIVNGNEAACHHHNALRIGEGGVQTIEVYRFDAGHLAVRYFIAG